MNNARVTVPAPRNEPVLNYAPGSPEKAALRAQLDTFAADSIEIPLIIGGRNVTTGDLGTCILPHDHRRSLATYHKGNAETVNQAIAAAADARAEWSAMPWESRAAIWLKAAELLAGRYRQVLNAATMLNQSKTAFQAEIDAACELIDFWRFNASYLPEIYAQQPASAPGMWNYVEYRALEGFIFAATPFNFTSIAGNLPTSPALSYSRRLGCRPASSIWCPVAVARSATRRWRIPTLGACTSPAARRCSRACGAPSAPTSPATRAIPGSSVRPAARTSCSPMPRPTPTNWRPT